MHDLDEITALRERLQEAETIVSRLAHGNATTKQVRDDATAFLAKYPRSSAPTALDRVVLPIWMSRRAMFALKLAADQDHVTTEDMAVELIRKGLQNRRQTIRRKQGNYRRPLAA